MKIPTFLPNKGQALNSPQEFLIQQYSPYSRNVEYYNALLQGRSGLSKLNSSALPDRIMLMKQFWEFTGTWHEMVMTKRDICSYDFGNSRFDFLTPMYAPSGHKFMFENGSDTLYGGYVIDEFPSNMDDATGGDVSCSTTGSGARQGGMMAVNEVAAAAGVGLLVTKSMSSTDLSAYDSVGFWFKSSVDLDEGDLQFNLDDTALCASPLETIDLPDVTADTWTWINLTLNDPSLLTAVISFGFTMAVDKGAFDFYVDFLVAGDLAEQATAGDFIKTGTTDLHSGSTWYEVDTVNSDTQITLTESFAESDADSAFSIRQTFTGGDTDYWDAVTFQDNLLGSIFVMTNGVNTPVYYTGSGQAVEITGLPTAMTAARFVATYKDRLIFLSIVQGGINEKQRWIWSDVANAVSYDEDDFADLVDEDTWINGHTKFGGYFIIFKEEEAYIVRWVGGNDVFDWEKSASSHGCKAPKSIITDKNFVYYYGNDERFHRWNLIRDESISELIHPDTSAFDPNLEQYIFGGYISGKKQIRWFCPYNNDSYHDYVVVYDTVFEIMQIWEYEQEQACCCMDEYINTSDLYVDDATWGEYYVDEHEGYWDDRTFLSDAPIPIYGGYDGYIRNADTGETDDGEEYRRVFRTKRINFNAPDLYKRLKDQQWWFEAESSGNVTVKIKLDDRESFEAAQKTISLANTERAIIKENITWDKRAQNFQFEVEATNFFALLGFISDVYPKARSI